MPAAGTAVGSAGKIATAARPRCAVDHLHSDAASAAACTAPRARRPVTDWPHGTVQRYDQGCRGVECGCREANRLANAFRRRVRRSQMTEVDHGRPDGVRNFGCNCIRCRRANRVDVAPRVRAHRERNRTSNQGATA